MQYRYLLTFSQDTLRVCRDKTLTALFAKNRGVQAFRQEGNTERYNELNARTF
jgi:hypothetical protein